MRVILVSDMAPPQVSGVSTCFATIARELGRRGHQVLAVVPSFGRKAVGLAGENIVLRAVRSFPVFVYPDFRMTLPRTRSLVNAFRDFGADVLHVHTPLILGFSAMRAANVLHLPAVGTDHLFLTRDNQEFLRWIPGGRMLRGMLGYAVLRWDRRFYGRCDMRTAASPELVEAAMRESGKTYLHLQNPLDLSVRIADPATAENLRRRHNLRSRVVLHVGRLSGEKRIDVLMRAFAEVARRRRDTSLLIVGDGPARASLERLAGELEIRDAVVFTGSLDHDSLMESGLLGVADCFVTASPVENQPMAVLEAMASGQPIVGVAATGLLALVKENGILVAPGDHAAMAEAMLGILGDEAQRSAMSAASLLEARRYGVERVTDRLVEIYEEATHLTPWRSR